MFSRRKKRPTISKPFHPDASSWNRDWRAEHNADSGPRTAPARGFPAWHPPVPQGFYSPGSPPWKSSASSSEQTRFREDRFEGSSSQTSSAFTHAHVPRRVLTQRSHRDLRAAASQYPPKWQELDATESEEEELQQPTEFDDISSDNRSERQLDQRRRRPHRPSTPRMQHHRRADSSSSETSATELEQFRQLPRKASEPYLALPGTGRHRRQQLTESDLYADKTVISTAYSDQRRRHQQPHKRNNGTSVSSKSGKKSPSAPASDGSDTWCTRTSEPLAKVRLNTVLKSLEESEESLFFNLTSFTLDLSEPDPAGSPTSKFLSLACDVLGHLSRLESLRLVGPKDTRIVLPASLAAALTKSRAGLLSFSLSRISSIENVAVLARLVGPTCTTLKLNDCKLQVWRPFLRHCVYLENLEGLVPPEGLSWLSRAQWSQLLSLRLGYGSPETLEDLLESATAVEGEEPYQTALETLVISHFAPLPLPLIIRLSRTLGTPLVRKLEISRVSASIWEPRLLRNLAAYFDSVEDLRLHSADDGEEELSLQEGRKARIKPVDWTRGRYGIDDWGLALSAFSILRAVEINHSRYPFLVSPENLRGATAGQSDKKRKEDTTKPGEQGEPEGIPTTPDGVSLSELWLVDARDLANKCRTLKRVGYSFGVQGRYLDCSVKFSKTQRGALPQVVPHWTRPTHT